MVNHDGFLDAIRQQMLPSHRFSPGTTQILAFVLSLGILCVGIGISFTLASNSIREEVVDYTHLAAGSSYPLFVNLTNFKGPVYIYYQLERFSQLYYTMRNSLDINHFMVGDYSFVCTGETYVQRRIRNWTYLKEVFPLIYSFVQIILPKSREKSMNSPVPCGERARWFFNDQVEVFDEHGFPVPFHNRDITWDVDRKKETFIDNPPTFDPTDQCSALKFGKELIRKPDNWKTHICDMEGAMKNEDFLVWMRPAAAPTFRKLWKKLDLVHAPENGGQNYAQGLPDGNYRFDVQVNWPPYPLEKNHVDQRIRKKIVITTVNWAGGKSNFLGYAYLVVGTLILFVGCFLACLQSRHPTHLQDQNRVGIRWRRRSFEFMH